VSVDEQVDAVIIQNICSNVKSKNSQTEGPNFYQFWNNKLLLGEKHDEAHERVNWLINQMKRQEKNESVKKVKAPCTF
jgi:hypothetical protein